MPFRRYQMALRIQQMILWTLAVGHAGVGLTFFLPGISLPGILFDEARNISDTAWGVWALVSGLGIFFSQVRAWALLGTTAWYALWVAVLFPGLFEIGGPFYAIPIYSMLLVLHGLYTALEVAENPPHALIALGQFRDRVVIWVRSCVPS